MLRTEEKQRRNTLYITFIQKCLNVKLTWVKLLAYFQEQIGKHSSLDVIIVHYLELIQKVLIGMSEDFTYIYIQKVIYN